MLMRRSDIKNFQESMGTFTDVLIDAMDGVEEQKLRMSWHPTRVWEYPWSLERCPPAGHILDIGSDPKWYAGLIGMGHKVVSHHVYSNATDRGRIHAWENNGTGGIPMNAFYEKYKHQATCLLGFLDDLTYVKDNYFDTIYCLSVIEHVPTEELMPLLDGMVRMLKPDGRLCITADWYPHYAVGEGKQGFVTNYDLSPLLDKLVPVTPMNEIPWQPDFKSSEVFSDNDVLSMPWGEDFLVVYGLALQKK
jgi:SAM-dependent methyltransferase